MSVLNYNAKRGPSVYCTATLTNIYRNCHFVVPKSTPPPMEVYEISGGSKPTFLTELCDGTRDSGGAPKTPLWGGYGYFL